MSLQACVIALVFRCHNFHGGASTAWLMYSALLQVSLIDHKAVFMTMSGLRIINPHGCWHHHFV